MASAFTVAFTPTPIPAATSVIVEATPQISAGRNFVPRSSYRVITVLAAAGISPANIAAAYVAKFGALVVGSKIFIRLTAVNATTMSKGDPVETSAIVA